MKLPNCTINSDFYVQDNDLLNSEADRIKGDHPPVNFDRKRPDNNGGKSSV